ncbi:glucagon receptor-like [Electrophorus electricus]|uniref:glucagon receptor-like n=1 Tax=Electrophorus electricus TaxID=8005 RepID=UPI0015D04040|nr:glucagon receptor-like [Electrophorus electricus]
MPYRCWEVNGNMAYWWIIRTPILLAILVNFFIFMRIIQILISKLKVHQMRYTDYKFRLAKSTLTLIPLLGIHEVVFAVGTEEQTEGILRSIILFFHLFFSSFQGFLVAILYCFVNKEVQSEIKKKWQRWKLGISVLDDRNTGSHTAQGFKCSQDHPCQQDCSERDSSHKGPPSPLSSGISILKLRRAGRTAISLGASSKAFVRKENMAKAADEGSGLKLLRRQGGLEGEVLEEGGEEDEALHLVRASPR